jgi:hypothetical protein
MHAAHRRRLALVAFLLLTVGASVTVALPGDGAQVGGQPVATSRLTGPDAVANALLIATTPKGAARSITSSTSKRQLRSFLEAAVGSALGLVLVRRHRAVDMARVVPRLARRLARVTRAPPAALLTLS